MFIKYFPVCISGKCNFNCICCDNTDLPEQVSSYTEIEKHLLNISHDTDIEFVGREIFLRKDVFSIIKFASKRFRRVKYNTNGAAFFYKGLTHDAILSGMQILNFKFYSINPEIHRKITRTDSLNYVRQGFENLVILMEGFDHSLSIDEGRKFALVVQIPVNSLTVRDLKETVEFISRNKPTRIVLNCRNAEVLDKELFDLAKRCIDIALKNETWPLVSGLPACVLTGYEEYIAEIYRVEKHVPEHILLTNICDRCALGCVCSGVHEKLADKFNWQPINGGETSGRTKDLLNIYRCVDSWGS